MRIVCILILFLGISSIKVLSQADFDEGLPKYPLKTIITSCQNKTDKSLTITKLTWNNKRQLVKSALYYDTIQAAEIIFNYDDNELLISKDYYSRNYQNQTLDYSRTKIYTYDLKNNLIYEGYDDEKAYNLKHNYYYSKEGKMLTSTTECNFVSNEYKYIYDSENRLKEKYREGKLEISYEYAQDRLIKEIHYNKIYTYKEHQETTYTYEYNEKGFLISKRQNDKVVEKNIYDSGFLVERRTYYFGIDPCYSPCCGQYIMTYNY